MEKFRALITGLAPVVIVVLSVIIAGIGLHHAGMGKEQIYVLCAFLTTFTWLLSESLEFIFKRWENDRPKAWTTICAAGFLAAVEVWIHHYGAIWLFGDIHFLAQYGASLGFVFLTVTAKWLYMTKDKEPAKNFGAQCNSWARDNLMEVCLYAFYDPSVMNQVQCPAHHVRGSMANFRGWLYSSASNGVPNNVLFCEWVLARQYHLLSTSRRL